MENLKIGRAVYKYSDVLFIMENLRWDMLDSR